MDERYSRQVLVTQIGNTGQARLAASSVLVVGCGALGSTLANLLARAGVGRVRLADRDVVELGNLHRQVLYDEKDVEQALPKAVAAARRLRRANSLVEVEARVTDVDAGNVEQLLAGMTLVVDGTDNLATRFLLNDVCVKKRLPWIYGGVVGTSGMTMTVVPGQGPCLRCLFPEPPEEGQYPTPEREGVLGTLPATIAAIQATEAIKLICGAPPSDKLLCLDLWSGSVQQTPVARDEGCPCCVKGELTFLDAPHTTAATCRLGDGALQLRPLAGPRPDLQRLAQRLAPHGKVHNNGMLLRFVPHEQDWELLLFDDGRVLLRGVDSAQEAERLRLHVLRELAPEST